MTKDIKEIKELKTKIKDLKISDEMKTFFDFFIFRNPNDVEEFIKYFINEEDWEERFLETLDMFSFFDKKEIWEYKKYYNYLVNLVIKWEI